MLTESNFPRRVLAKTTTATLLAISVSSAFAAPPPVAYTVSNLPANAIIPFWDNRILNENGQVTGRVIFPGGLNSHAFRFDGTTLTDLGSLAGPSGFSEGVAINASGQVTGTSYNGFTYRAFLYDGSTMKDLGGLTTDSQSFSAGRYINDHGQVSGDARAPIGFNSRAFLHDGTSMREVGPPSVEGSYYSVSSGINANGQIAGYARGPVEPGHAQAFYYDGTAASYSGTLSGNLGDISQAVAINASGQVAGWGYDGAKEAVFLYEGGVLKNLGTLTNQVMSQAYPVGINSRGDIAGYSSTESSGHAFLYSGGIMRDLGNLGTSALNNSYANALNNQGHVVGTSHTGSTYRAFIHDGQSMVDLNTRLVNAPGIELEQAFAISDSGYIVARTTTGGFVLLKPAVVGPSPSPATIGAISANDPVAVGSPVNVSALFADVNASDTHTATWTWEGNGTTTGIVTEANGATPGSVTGNKIFAVAGVYNVTVDITDSAGLKSQVSRQIVVYDPSAGFVTGGGWINSPAGAYKAEAMLAGKANFAFVSKYQKGATKPSGETEFQFHAAKLNFQSNNYEWLVVGGARAQYKGTGTINGAGSYKFLLTAVDGDLIAKGTADRLRMKIWHYDEATKTDVVDYDNQITTGTEGSNLEGTGIGGGSISIKTR